MLHWPHLCLWIAFSSCFFRIHSPCPMGLAPNWQQPCLLRVSHSLATGGEFMTLCLGLKSSESPPRDGAAATLAGRQTLCGPSPPPCSLHSFTGFLWKISFIHQLHPNPHSRVCSGARSPRSNPNSALYYLWDLDFASWSLHFFICRMDSWLFLFSRYCLPGSKAEQRRTGYPTWKKATVKGRGSKHPLQGG